MKNWFFANENIKTKRERKVLTSFTLLLTRGFTLFLKAMFFYFSLSQQRPKIKDSLVIIHSSDSQMIKQS